MDHTILIGEDEPIQRQMLTALLTRKLGYKTLAAENGRQVIRRIKNSNFGEISAVLLDLEMPEMGGMEALKELRRYRPDLPVLILTGREDVAIAVQAIKEGASDFLIKPADPIQLDVALKNAIRLSTLSRELNRLQRDREGALRFADLIGYEGGLAKTVADARKGAASDVTVLLTGEVSTGKELLARAMHGESRRVGAPFVAFNCSALPQHTLEVTLFGQERQPNSSARIPGKFREAERGMLFLDDIHALSPEAQVKLLRAIQQREIEPIGAEKPVKINVRLISATDQDLKKEVQEGRFREDLYFRLNVLTIAIPALRERPQDILPLAEYFLQRIASADGLPLKSLTADARHYLTEFTWPGNVREIEALMHRALVLGEQDVIDRALLKVIHDAEVMGSNMPVAGPHIALKRANGLPKTMEEIEAEAMQTMLEHYGGNITRAAEALGMAKSTFYRKIKHAPASS